MDCHAPATFPLIPLPTVDAFPGRSGLKAFVTEADMVAVPDIGIDGFLLLLFAHFNLTKTLNEQPLRDEWPLFDLPAKSESWTGALMFAEVHSKPRRKLDALAQTERPTCIKRPHVYVFDAKIVAFEVQTAD